MTRPPLPVLKDIFEADSTDPRYVDYAIALMESGSGAEALTVCLRGLSHDPTSVKGRLALAEAFFQQGFVPFAVREVQELTVLAPGNESITKLLAKLDPRVVPVTSSVQPEKPITQVVEAQEAQTSEIAEEDFSIDDLESLETK